MDEALTQEVKVTLQEVIKNTKLPDSSTFETDAMRAVKFLMHCTVHHAYATVEKTFDKDGFVKPLVLVKAKLRFKSGKSTMVRTVIDGLAPILTQLLKTVGWEDELASHLERLLRPSLKKRVVELEGEIKRQIEIIQKDRNIAKKMRDGVQEIISQEVNKLKGNLRESFKMLLRYGFVEEDAISIWRETICQVTHDL